MSKKNFMIKGVWLNKKEYLKKENSIQYGKPCEICITYGINNGDYSNL